MNLTGSFSNSSLTSRDALGELWVWAAVSLTIVSLGAFNNGLVILAIWKFVELRNATKILLLNLAVGSLLFDLITGPLIVFNVMARLYMPLPENWCRYFTYFQHCTSINATLSVCAIAVNRSVAVVFPYCYRRISSKRALFIFALPCWIIPAVVGLFGVTEYAGQFRALPNFGYCVAGTPAMTLLIQICYLYAPTVVLVACYSAIVVKLLCLRRKTIPRAGHGVSGPMKLLIRRRARTSGTVFLCVVAFVCTNYPAILVFAVSPEEAARHPLLFLWLRSLFFMATLLNPVRDPHSGLLDWPSIRLFICGKLQ